MPPELLNHPFFKLVDPERADRIARSAKLIQLKTGEVLFEEGSPSDSIYLVLGGSILINKVDPSGKLVDLARVNADDYFGEFGVLDGGPRSARATAATDAKLARISREEILEILGTPGEAARRLVVHIIHKIRASNSWYVTEMLRQERMTMVGRMANKIIHDFKNPFAVIRMAAEMLGRKNPGDPDTQRMTEMIADQIDRIVVMADDILQFSRGNTTLNPDFFDVADMLAQFESLYALYLKEQGVELTLKPIRKFIKADDEKLLRVLQNLVNNAAESFRGKPGRISIEARDLGQEVELAVRDNGPGLPESIRAKPFEMFGSEGKSTGTGLGMAITRSIVQAHGGTINFETETGVGTSFLIRIPIKPPAKSAEPAL